MIIATAEKCLEESTIEYVVFEKTKINTPLGPIVIIEVTKEGLVLVAGPSTNTEMKRTIDSIKKYNVEKILIDGALFRKSIANTYLSDAIILSTGASYHTDMDVVVEDTTAIIDQLAIKEFENNKKDHVRSYESTVFFNESNNENIVLNESLLHNEDILSTYLSDFDFLYIAGALTNRIFDVLVKNRTNFKSLEIILDDATNVLLEPTKFRKLSKLGVKLSVLNQIDILFVTFNPFSPFGYEFKNNLFRQKLNQNIKYDLINVVTDLE